MVSSSSVTFITIFQFHFNQVLRKFQTGVRNEQIIWKPCQFFCDSWQRENRLFWFLRIVTKVEQWQTSTARKYRGLFGIKDQSKSPALEFPPCCCFDGCSDWFPIQVSRAEVPRTSFQSQKPSSCVSNSYFSLSLVNWIAIWVCVPSAIALDPRHDLYCSLVRLGSHFLSWKWWKRSLSGARIILEENKRG